MKSHLLTAGLVCLIITPLHAAPIEGRVIQDAAISADSIDRITIGGGYESINREINLGSDPDAKLRANAFFGSISYDITANASLVLGLNQSTVDRLGSASTLDDRDDVDWFAAAQVNLWEHMLKAPTGEDARLSIGLMGGMANYMSVGNGQEATWENTVIALPFGYQLFSPGDVRSTVQSTKFFAGPILSMIDGDITTPAGKASFDESENNGVLFGVDVFATEHFVVGGQIEFMDDYSFSFNARYHF